MNDKARLFKDNHHREYRLKTRAGPATNHTIVGMYRDTSMVHR